MTGDREQKEVFHIVEREGKKSIWTRVGVGFVNKDNSINVLLNTLPIDGKLHIRNRSEPEKTKE